MIMKLLITVILLAFGTSSFSQADSNYINLVELVHKAQNDKTLRGTFMYKGYKANIGKDKQLRTTIGDFIRMTWQAQGEDEYAPYQALFHTTLGYMTRTIFGTYAREFGKTYKVGTDKYCKDNNCVELLTVDKLPCIIIYPRSDNQINEIK